MQTTHDLKCSKRPRLPGILVLACAAILGCTSNSPQAQARPYIPQIEITISPTEATVQPGASAVFTAYPSGGEAIRLTVDWSIQEGAAGGSFTVLENEHGNSSVKYTAPASGTGPYHLVASVHGFPSVKAIATIK